MTTEQTPPLDLLALHQAWSTTLADETYPENENEALLLNAIPGLLKRILELENREANYLSYGCDYWEAQYVDQLRGHEEAKEQAEADRDTLRQQLTATREREQAMRALLYEFSSEPPLEDGVLARYCIYCGEDTPNHVEECLVSRAAALAAPQGSQP